MKLFIYTFCLLFIYTCAGAQVRRALNPGYGEPNFLLPQWTAFNYPFGSSGFSVEIGIPIYKQASNTELDLDETLDTSAVVKRAYNAKGLLTETRYYKYYPNRDFFGADNRILSAQSNIFEYDGHNNVILGALYSLIPANSGIAAREALGMKNEFGQPEIYGHKVDFTEDSAAIKKYVDSFLKANVPEHYKEMVGKCSYTYDTDGNLVYTNDSIDNIHYHYTYKYNADGRVAIQQAVRYQGPSSYSTNESDFTYSPEGKPATINIYSGSNDSENIAGDNFWQKEQSYHYNTTGLIDIILVKTKDNTTKTIIAYQDGRISAATTLNIRENHADTLHQYFYKYRENRLVVYTDFEPNRCCTGNGGDNALYSMPAGYYTRTEYFYNTHHLLVEIRTKESINEKPYEKVIGQHLYFYGTKADKGTARRSLWKEHTDE